MKRKVMLDKQGLNTRLSKEIPNSWIYEKIIKPKFLVLGLRGLDFARSELIYIYILYSISGLINFEKRKSEKKLQQNQRGFSAATNNQSKSVSTEHSESFSFVTFPYFVFPPARRQNSANF